jgi:hypothetical protein
VDRVGGRRAPRARRERAAARALLPGRKRRARQPPGKAPRLAGGEQEPKLKTATAEEAARAQAAAGADEEGLGANRARLGRAPAAAEAERARAEAAAERAQEEVAAERAPARGTQHNRRKGVPPNRWHALSIFTGSGQSPALPPSPMETPTDATRSFWKSSPPPKSPLYR